jgi:hypothetical protein
VTAPGQYEVQEIYAAWTTPFPTGGPRSADLEASVRGLARNVAATAR